MVSNETKIKAYLSSFTCSLLDHQNKTLHLHNPDSGAEVEYAARSGKIYDSRGRVAYTVTVLRDFSAWKKLEQLQMERRMLEMEKFAATGRLAGTIAHEINNPMEAIKNAIYLLKSRVEPEAQPIYEALKSETDRVTRIVRQMLGLYRNAGQLGTFDLNSIVEDTLALFARPLDRTGALVKKRRVAGDEGICRPIPATALQRSGECSGQHAERRTVDDQHALHEVNARIVWRGQHCGGGYGQRYSEGDSKPDVRPLRQHQRGKRDWAWALDCPGDCGKSWGTDSSAKQ